MENRWQIRHGLARVMGRAFVDEGWMSDAMDECQARQSGREGSRSRTMMHHANDGFWGF